MEQRGSAGGQVSSIFIVQLWIEQSYLNDLPRWKRYEIYGDLGFYKHNTAVKRADIDKKSGTGTSHGGEKMGETLVWNSFTEFDGSRKATGLINFGSFQARNWLDKFRNAMDGATDKYGDFLARMQYAVNAGGFNLSGNSKFGLVF